MQFHSMISLMDLRHYRVPIVMGNLLKMMQIVTVLTLTVYIKNLQIRS